MEWILPYQKILQFLFGKTRLNISLDKPSCIGLK